MSTYQILVVDDEPDIRNLVRDILKDEGFDVETVASAAEARQYLFAHDPDLVFLDIWMSDEDGISLLKEWHNQGGVKFPVLIMSGHGTVETAVEATQLGASGFIEKPLTTAKLLQSVRNVLPEDPASSSVKQTSRGYELTGSSEVMENLRQQAEQIALSDRHVWINAENGTRPVALAEHIHALSTQANEPLIIASPVSDQIFENAQNKVLYIDRDELSPEYEARLIRILKKTPQKFSRVILRQGNHDTRSKVTVTGAEDNDALFDLLNPLVIQMPTLHTHTEDMPELIHAVIDYYCQQYRLPYRKFSIAAQNYLLHHHWPGNLIELDTLVYELLENSSSDEIALHEVKDAIRQNQLPDAWFEEVLNKPLREAREIFEKMYLERQLKRVRGNVSQLAVKTDMERTHLYRKLRSLGIRYKTTRKPE